MEMFWFFWLRIRRAYDSAYDSDFLFSLGHKFSYDFDSVASENQPLIVLCEAFRSRSSQICSCVFSAL